MKKIITEFNLKIQNMILSLIVVWVGFIFTQYGEKIFKSNGTGTLHYVNWLIIIFLSVISLFILIGKEGMKLAFNIKKLKFFKTILLIIGVYIVSFIIAIIIGYVENKVLKFNIRQNVAAKQNLVEFIVTLPGYIFFEEAWTAVMLIIVTHFVYKGIKKYNSSFWISTIIVAIIFGLGHIPAYFNGNWFDVIIHVLIMQAVARVIFNFATLKSNTILIPFIIHTIYDFLTVMIAKK